MIPSDPNEQAEEVDVPQTDPSAPVEAEDEDLAEDADGLEPAPEPETGDPEPTDPDQTGA